MKDMNNSGSARWNEMAKVWVNQGYKVTVIASMYLTAVGGKHPDYKGKLFKIEEPENGLQVIRVHTSEKYNRSFLWRTWAYFTFMFFGFWGAVFLARGKYDLVLASSPPLNVGPLGIALSIIKRCPFVFEVRDLWPRFAIETGVLTNPLLIRLMNLMEKISYKKAMAINVLTPSFKDELVQTKKISANKILMIPNGVDLTLMKPGSIDNELRAKHGWTDKFIALYIGAHGKSNCLWQLIETAKILKDESIYQIVCIGNGMERDALIQRAKEEGLRNISFLPAVAKNEIGAYLCSCDISLVVLKKIDAYKTVYPNKMFDSMSVAKPIVLAIDGVARKLVVDDAECGLFAEPENAKEIAEKIHFYQKSPDIAKEHGENGYRYACEHYDRRKLAAKYIMLLEKSISGSQ